MMYLDHAATTKIDPKVLEVLTEANNRFFANASSLHDLGNEANQALKQARTTLAGTLGVDAEEIVFTSGGTEANQLAILTLLESLTHGDKHLITTRIEHSSIYNLFKKLETKGYQVTYLDVDETGLISLERLKGSITNETTLVAIQHTNSEIGVIQNIKDIGKFLSSKGINFHSDLIQSYGKIPLDLKEMNLTSAAVSSHKIYGPKGIGLTYFSKEMSYQPYYPQTTHEFGFRPGTVDVPSALAFAYAGQEAIKQLNEDQQKAKELRNHLEYKLQESNKIVIHSHPTNQLNQIIAISINGLQGQYAMLECNRYNLAISTGSACQIGQTSPSRTMMSMGKTEDKAKELIRISTGRYTTKEEMDYLANVLIKISQE